MARSLGVLLAGGRGARLGYGQPKALALFQGRWLLANALGVLRAVCDEIVVCAPRDMILPIGDELRVNDPDGDAGPLAAMVTGLRSRPSVAALALAVDLPLLAPGLLAAMKERLAGAPAVVPSPGGRLQPLAAWYAPPATDALAVQFEQGERSIGRAVHSLGPRVLRDADLEALGAHEHSFLNVNTEADMAEAERMARAWKKP